MSSCVASQAESTPWYTCNAVVAVRGKSEIILEGEDEQACGLLLSLFFRFMVRSMFMKAHRTSNVGLSHRGAGCLVLSASCSLYALEPFFRSLSSRKRAFSGQAISRCSLQQCAELFPFCCRAEGAFSNIHWLIFGNVLVYVGCHHRTPSCPSPLSPTSLLCAVGCDQILPQMFLTAIPELFSKFYMCTLLCNICFLCMYLQLPSLLSHPC